jgi:beta-glucosidase
MKKTIMFCTAMAIFVSGGYTKMPGKIEIGKKVEKLISQMTLAEKVGQMTQVDMKFVQRTGDISKYFIGSVLSGGDSSPSDITAKGWANLYDSFQKQALKTRLKVPLIYGIDAVHGNNSVLGATIFPHNIGLGATRNPKLVEQIGKITALEVAATGINWAFAPAVSICRDERWGRCYESYGENPELVTKMGASLIKGLQGKDLSTKDSILATAKHFFGDGATQSGKDQGNAILTDKELRLHLKPYIEAIGAGAKSIMISFSSINGKKMHGNKELITDLLKGELGFTGFVLSDWGAVNYLSDDYKKAVELSINAGIDMVMVPDNYKLFTRNLTELVKEGRVPLKRIDDAVKRILTVKYELGLFTRPFVNKNSIKKIGSDKHKAVARRAVRQSLVLLKNKNNILPLSKNAKSILVVGGAINGIGAHDNSAAQCGGWTLNWQGIRGKSIPGTSILEAVKKAVSPETSVIFSFWDIPKNEKPDYAVVVVGENPYSEWFGDKKDISLSKDNMYLIEMVKSAGIPVVTILLSGRPMILGSALENSDAFIAAWLPGTEGEGIADVLFGDYKPTGKLPLSWPRDNEQLPINIGDENYDPLFPYGYGLSY